MIPLIISFLPSLHPSLCSFAGPGEAANEDGDSGDSGKSAVPAKPVMLVFFVGGISFIEIAALRFLSKSSDFPYTIIMGATSLVNGNTLMESITHDPTIL